MPESAAAPALPLWWEGVPTWVSALVWIAAGLLLLRGVGLLAERLTPWRPRLDVRWDLGDVLIVLCTFLLALAVLQAAAQGSRHPDDPDRRLPVVLASAVQMVAQLVAAAAIGVLAFRRHPRGQALARLGLAGGGQFRSAVLGCVAFAAAFFLVQGLFGIQGELWRSWTGEPLPQQTTLERVRAVQDPAGRAFVHFVAGIFAPVAEELVWRAWVQPVFALALGPLRGIALASFLFVVLGHGPEVWLPLFGFALVLGWVYHRTGRLAAPIALHATLNLSTLFLPRLLGGA